MKISLTNRLLQVGIFFKCGFVLPLQNLFSFNFCVLGFFCFHDLKKNSDYFFYREFYYHLDVGWDFELHWARSNIQLKFNSHSIINV
jgi:hypothetical protein